jgi:galactosyl transferase GMA12/MNN10 family
MIKRLFLFFFFTFCTSGLLANEIAVVTLAVGKDYRETVDLGIKNKRSYCNKHGYKFICGTRTLDSSRPIQWSKIKLILKTMENTSCKWIFWTDADSLIMNVDFPISNLIDEQYNFILSRDRNSLNTGQFLIRNCKWSREFLKCVYAREECIRSNVWEQQAVILELEQNPRWMALTKIIPQRSINSYPREWIGDISECTYQDGDFILHFAGIRNKKRLCSLFESYSRRISNCQNRERDENVMYCD